MTSPMTPEAVASILAEARRQDEVHPDGFEANRNGVRFGLCTIEDEIREAREAWEHEKRGCYDDPARWRHTRAELVQALAVGFRLLCSIEERAFECDRAAA
jgi:hypothetical protein